MTKEERLLVQLYYQDMAAKKGMEPEQVRQTISQKISYAWEHPDDRLQRKNPEAPHTDDFVLRILLDDHP